MPKINYHQARKQKEQARKSRQQEKQQRRGTRALPSPATTDRAGTDAVTSQSVDPTSLP